MSVRVAVVQDKSLPDECSGAVQTYQALLSTQLEQEGPGRAYDRHLLPFVQGELLRSSFSALPIL